MGRARAPHEQPRKVGMSKKWGVCGWAWPRCLRSLLRMVYRAPHGVSRAHCAHYDSGTAHPPASASSSIRASCGLPSKSLGPIASRDDNPTAKAVGGLLIPRSSVQIREAALLFPTREGRTPFRAGRRRALFVLPRRGRPGAERARKRRARLRAAPAVAGPRAGFWSWSPGWPCVRAAACRRPGAPRRRGAQARLVMPPSPSASGR